MKSWSSVSKRLAAALFFAAVVFLGYARYTDPNVLYFDDLGRLFIPLSRFSYASPGLASSRAAALDYFLGSAGGVSTLEMPVAIAVPWLGRLLSIFAPASIQGLSVFEWRLTSIYMLLGMLGLFLLLTRKGMDRVMAAAFTAAWPFTGPIFREWQHTPQLRGRLLIPLVLVGLDWAIEKQTNASWLTAGLLILATLVQSTSLYWMIVVFVLWVMADFVSKPPHARHSRQLYVPALALAMVLAFSLPLYFQMAKAIGRSAFRASLGQPAHFIQYFGALKDNCSWDRILQPFPWNGAGLGPLFLAGIFLPLGCFLYRSLHPMSPKVRVDHSAKIGLVLMFFGAALSSVPLLPEPWVLSLVFPVARPLGLHPSFLTYLLPQIFHVSWRTWFVMAYSGGLLFLASFVPAWMRSEINSDTREAQAAFALGIYACGLAVAMRLFKGGIDWQLLCASCFLIFAVLSAFVLSAETKPSAGKLGLGLFLFIGTASSFYLSTSYFAKAGNEPYGERFMRAESDIVEHVPPGVKNQYFYRLAADAAFPNLCLYLRCSSLDSYPVRVVPNDVLRFFNELGVLNEISLPYYVYFNFERLSALGLVRMLGLKHWILASPPPSFLAGSKSTVLSAAGSVRYYELRDVFARAWPLQHWTTADSLWECTHRVSQLGAAGALGKEGVLFGRDATKGLSPSRSSISTPAYTEIVKSEPGRIVCKTRNSKEVVLATNEIYNESWSATVDGKTAIPLKVNCIFLGVPVAPGEHDVEFHSGAVVNTSR